jgi:hypothetical protein
MLYIPGSEICPDAYTLVTRRWIVRRARLRRREESEGESVHRVMADSSRKLRFDQAFLEVTAHCNFNCRFCTNAFMDRPRGMMSGATFRRLIDEIATQGLADTVLFHLMGEPLLHPELMALVRYAVERVPRQHLVTNGSLFTPTTIKECYETQLTQLSISYFTPTVTLFALRHARNVSFQHYRRIIHDAVQCKFEQGFDTHLRLLYPNINLQSFNWEGAPFDRINTDAVTAIVQEWTAFVTELGIHPHRINWNVIRHWNRNERCSVYVTDDFEIVFKPFHNWHNTHQAVHKAPMGKCSLVLNHEQLGILWNGDVVLCCGDYNGETAYGNIHTMALPDVLHAVPYRTILARFAKGRIPFEVCQQCLGTRSRSSVMWNALGTYYVQALAAKLGWITSHR